MRASIKGVSADRIARTRKTECGRCGITLKTVQRKDRPKFCAACRSVDPVFCQ